MEKLFTVIGPNEKGESSVLGTVHAGGTIPRVEQEPEPTAPKNTARVRHEAKEPISEIERIWRIFSGNNSEMDEKFPQVWKQALETDISLYPEIENHPVWLKTLEMFGKSAELAGVTLDESIRIAKNASMGINPALWKKFQELVHTAIYTRVKELMN